MSACRVKACPVPARPGQLMCRDHWYKVPKPLRDAIWATWKAHDLASYTKNVHAALDVITPPVPA